MPGRAAGDKEGIDMVRFIWLVSIIFVLAGCASHKPPPPSGAKWVARGELADLCGKMDLVQRDLTRGEVRVLLGAPQKIEQEGALEFEVWNFAAKPDEFCFLRAGFSKDGRMMSLERRNGKIPE